MHFWGDVSAFIIKLSLHFVKILMNETLHFVKVLMNETLHFVKVLMNETSLPQTT